VCSTVVVHIYFLVFIMSNRFKIVLLGEGRVGKTSILLRYIRGEYSDNQISTLQASYLDKKITVSGANVQLSVWDTAGQERFHALGPIYYRDASKCPSICVDGLSYIYIISDGDTLWSQNYLFFTPTLYFVLLTCLFSSL